MSNRLLPNLPDVPLKTTATPDTAPRYERPNRAQVELYPCDLERLRPADEIQALDAEESSTHHGKASDPTIR